jgi:hypothetical protein
MSDNQINNIVGWSVAGALFIAYKLAGFWPVVGLLLLFVVLLVAVAHINAKFFNQAHGRHMERSRKENEAAKAELAKTLREVTRLRAQVDRRRPTQSLWGRN